MLLLILALGQEEGLHLVILRKWEQALGKLVSNIPDS